jgi:nicotinamidase-related amidase
MDYTDPEHNRSALITIDMQREFLDGQPFEIAGTSSVLPTIARVAQFFRTRARPIVHVIRLYHSDGSNVDISRRRLVEQGAEIVRPGSEGAQLAEGLVPREIRVDAEALLAGRFQRVGPHEWLMYKPRWGAFFGTALEDHLRALNVSTLVFAGCNFPNCPRTSIYEASERDFRIVAVEDAISGFYDRGRSELAGIGVCVLTAQTLLDEAERNQ